MDAQQNSPLTKVTVRSILIGIACVATICRVEAYNDYYVNNTWLAAHHFPIAAVFLLTVLVLCVNVVLKKINVASPLTSGELITIWCMMIVTASLPSGESIPWGVWLKPLLFWSIFTFTLWGVMVCMSVILRKQWVEREKFAFPLVQLPAEMSQNPEGASIVNDFFKSKAMWIAFAFPVVIHSISTLYFYFPILPEIPF